MNNFFMDFLFPFTLCAFLWFIMILFGWALLNSDKLERRVTKYEKHEVIREITKENKA